MNCRKLVSRRNVLRLTSCSLLTGPAIACQSEHVVVSALAKIDQPSTRDDNAFISRAFEMQRVASHTGDQPYGAIVVKDLIIVGQSPSRVIVNNDPIAHAEIEAIRDAASRLGSRNLAGCTLYSSSKACPMCEAASYWSGISRMIYGENGSDGGLPSLC